MYSAKHNLTMNNTLNSFAYQGDFEIRVDSYQFDVCVNLKERAFLLRLILRGRLQEARRITSISSAKIQNNV